MKRDLLSHLACPQCGGELVFTALEKLPLTERSDVAEGKLGCKSCRQEYELSDGVPRLTRGELGHAALKTRDAFTFEWNRYPGSLPEDEAVFSEESQLSATAFTGKLVLDAGCGMGRYAVVALSWGAEVIALDLSDSLLRIAEVAVEQPKLHVVQGDLLAPPLKPGCFDIVYSHGVLHHACDTREAFRRVAALVKPGGHLSVWLYGKAGRYGDFCTNPLKAERGWVARHRLAAWLVVAARHAVSDFIRFFTTRLPMRLTYLLCYPLAVLGAVPLVRYLTFSVHRDFRVRLIENFDWVSPPYQWHHTKEELARWFDREGFDVLKTLPHGLVPKPGILGRKREAR